MSTVVIQGRSFELCRSHAARVAAEMPKTFDDFRELFAGVVGAVGQLLVRSPERRRTEDRRTGEERRFFPPRPEGRRRIGGRRATDRVD